MKILKDPLVLWRLSHVLYQRKIPSIPSLLGYWIRFFWAAYVPASASIGKGTRLGYGGLGVVIHKDAVIGRDCLIAQQVTIGGNFSDEGVPQIGDGVLVGAGAKILGPITIGNSAKIGANAVVLQNVPPGATAVGIPARIVSSRRGAESGRDS
jgi:serine O-acetyltransferase